MRRRPAPARAEIAPGVFCRRRSCELPHEFGCCGAVRPRQLAARSRSIARRFLHEQEQRGNRRGPAARWPRPSPCAARPPTSMPPAVLAAKTVGGARRSSRGTCCSPPPRWRSRRRGSAPTESFTVTASGHTVCSAGALAHSAIATCAAGASARIVASTTDAVSRLAPAPSGSAPRAAPGRA